jgi:hypothetical protein
MVQAKKRMGIIRRWVSEIRAARGTATDDMVAGTLPAG